MEKSKERSDEEYRIMVGEMAHSRDQSHTHKRLHTNTQTHRSFEASLLAKFILLLQPAHHKGIALCCADHRYWAKC